MAARISIADLSDATGIAPGLLAAEVATIQRESQLAPPPPPAERATEVGDEGRRSTLPPPPPRSTPPAGSDARSEVRPSSEQVAA